MSLNCFVQPLEDRRLMSATPPVIPVSPTLISEPVHEYVDISTKVRIGYMPTLKVARVSQLHAQINWGDGSPVSSASFERDKNGGIDVMGTHTYLKAGVFSVTSTVTETPLGTTSLGLRNIDPPILTVLGKVNTQASVTPLNSKLVEVAGQQFTATLASFQFLSVDTLLTATINWGDGNTSAGQITGPGPAIGKWEVNGTHTYPHTGIYTVHVKVYTQMAGSTAVKPSLFEEFVTHIQVLGKA